MTSLQQALITHTIESIVERFLSELDPRPCARFNIEHYIDLPRGTPKPKPDPLGGRHPNLSRSDAIRLIPQLKERNDRGAGIFITRNECNGQRSEGNVLRIRGPHADFDEATAAQITDAYNVLQPSIVVITSDSSKQHAYWQLIEGEVLNSEETKSINRALVAKFGADPAAVDTSRLLRIPGFRHMKYREQGRTPMVTVEYHSVSYSANELRKAFLPVPNGTTPLMQKPTRTEMQGGSSEFIDADQINQVASEIAQKKAELWSGRWEETKKRGGEYFTSQSEADLALAGHIARACIKAGIDKSELAQAVENTFKQSGLARRDKWLTRPDYRERTITKAIEDLPLISITPSSQPTLDLNSHGDIRNAKFFANQVRGCLIYIPSRGQWLRWDKLISSRARWTLCEKQEEVAAAKHVCALLLAQATALFSKDQDKGKKAVSEAISAHNYHRIQAMLKLAISEPGISVTENELNRDPHKLGVANGVVDLRSGQLLPNVPELLLTRYCNAEYINDAPCPLWTTFLDEVFEGDHETIDSIQRLLGYTLIGHANEEILVICYGFGSNGKSVFNNVVQEITGEYAVTAPSSLLVLRRSGDASPRNDLAALAGARYVSINEFQAGDRLDEQIVKTLAGRERISARYLHKEFFEYQPVFTPWLRTNHKPIITGEDDGIWRRLMVLRFGRQFKDHEKDPHLQEKLLAEREGILQWMLEGARLYLKDGLRPSPRMRMEAATYRRESDLLGEFLLDTVAADPNGRVNQTRLYADYQEWCEANGLRANSKKSFTQRLAERGYREGKSDRNRFYLGLSYPVLSAVSSPAAAQGGVDGISSNSDKSSQEHLRYEEPQIDSNPAQPVQPSTEQRYRSTNIGL
jgi:putative DNA primase/helicase